jgi:hypothetical protein
MLRSPTIAWIVTANRKAMPRGVVPLPPVMVTKPLPVVDGLEGARQLTTGVRLREPMSGRAVDHAARNSEPRTAGMSVDPSEYMRSTWSSSTVRSSGSSDHPPVVFADDSHQHKPPQKRSLVAGP